MSAEEPRAAKKTVAVFTLNADKLKRVQRPAAALASGAPALSDAVAGQDGVRGGPQYISALGEGETHSAVEHAAAKLVIPLPRAPNVGFDSDASSSSTQPAGAVGSGAATLEEQAAAALRNEYASGFASGGAAHADSGGDAARVIIAQPLSAEGNAGPSHAATSMPSNAAAHSQPPRGRGDAAAAELRDKLFRPSQKRVGGQVAAAPMLALALRGGAGVSLAAATVASGEAAAGSSGSRGSDGGSGTPAGARLELGADLARLPDDVDVSKDLSVFERVPIDAFGAAMLRGMGAREEDLHDADRVLAAGKPPVVLPGESAAAVAAAGGGAGSGGVAGGGRDPSSILLKGERPGLGASRNPLLMLEAYEKAARRPRKPGDAPLPPPPPEVAAMLAGRGISIPPVSARSVGAAAAAASAPGLAPSGTTGPTKAALIRQRKYPGIVDGAVVRIRDPGVAAQAPAAGAAAADARVDVKPDVAALQQQQEQAEPETAMSRRLGAPEASAAPLAIVVQTSGVPGLDQCRLQLLEAGLVRDAKGGAEAGAVVRKGAGEIVSASKHHCVAVLPELQPGSLSAAVRAAGKPTTAVASVTAPQFTAGAPADAEAVVLSAGQTTLLAQARLGLLSNQQALQIGALSAPLAPAGGVAASGAGAAAVLTAGASDSSAAGGGSLHAGGLVDDSDAPRGAVERSRSRETSRHDSGGFDRRKGSAERLAAVSAAAGRARGGSRGGGGDLDAERSNQRERSRSRSRERRRRSPSGSDGRHRDRGFRDRDSDHHHQARDSARDTDRDRDREGRSRDDGRGGTYARDGRRSHSQGRADRGVDLHRSAGSSDVDRHRDHERGHGNRDNDGRSSDSRRRNTRGTSDDKGRSRDAHEARHAHRHRSDGEGSGSRRNDDRREATATGRSEQHHGRRDDIRGSTEASSSRRDSGHRGGSSSDASRPAQGGAAAAYGDSSSSRSGSAGRGWVVPGLIVRVIDERWMRGRFFKCKGVVVEVPTVGMATLRLPRGGAAASSASSSTAPAAAGSGDVITVEGVPHAALETALPKPGGPVLVVGGRFRGSRGKLLERHAGRGEAVLEVRGAAGEAYDGQIITASYEDVCERAPPGGVGGMEEDDEE